MQTTEAEANKEPVKVQRFVRSKLQIFTDADEDKIKDRYDKFVNHLMSYGAIIHGSQFSTALGEIEGEAFVQFSVCVYFDVPVNVTDELIKQGLEQQ
jgi:hypothetical protein